MYNKYVNDSFDVNMTTVYGMADMALAKKGFKYVHDSFDVNVTTAFGMANIVLAKEGLISLVLTALTSKVAS